MKFWGVRMQPYPVPIPMGANIYSSSLPGPFSVHADAQLPPIPTWAPFQGQPTAWIPFSQTGAALAVARVWGMRSIGISARLAIMARGAWAEKCLPPHHPERMHASFELACLHNEFDTMRDARAAGLL